MIFVDDVEGLNLPAIGPEMEKHAMFPERANIEFAQVTGPHEVQMRVWERGSGETLACGTGACACAVASVLTGKADRDATVHLRGGDLHVFCGIRIRTTFIWKALPLLSLTELSKSDIISYWTFCNAKTNFRRFSICVRSMRILSSFLPAICLWISTIR